jgi:hypothetical protein
MLSCWCPQLWVDYDWKSNDRGMKICQKSVGLMLWRREAGTVVLPKANVGYCTRSRSPSEIVVVVHSSSYCPMHACDVQKCICLINSSRLLHNHAGGRLLDAQGSIQEELMNVF